MAFLTRKDDGYYKAHWISNEIRKEGGKLKPFAVQKSKMTAHRDQVRAFKKACELEAEDAFRNQADARIIDFMAQSGLSPTACYMNFSHRAHMKRERFSQLCREAGVQFLEHKDWIDKKRRAKRKRYRYSGKLRSLDEILHLEQSPLSLPTVEARVKKGMSIEEAITKPSRQQAKA